MGIEMKYNNDRNYFDNIPKDAMINAIGYKNGELCHNYGVTLNELKELIDSGTEIKYIDYQTLLCTY